MYDIAIIGYGPTGATLGNLLAQQGVSVLVLEREAVMYHLPRAVHFDDEVMRVFQTVGIADDLVGKTHANPGMKFVDGAGNLLLDWPRPHEITMHGWNASYRLHQPDLETLLRDRLAEEPTAKIVTDFEVTEVTETTQSVTSSGRNHARGEPQQYQARFVVGCDGANSLIRSVIGSEMNDFGFEERWLVVDLLLKTPRPDLGDHSVQFCSPERPMTYCRSPGMRRRWEITIKDNESDAEITEPDRVWELLSRWITPDDAELERCAVYTFRSQVAQVWRKGRMMIAGDAAHLTPPFMGQGMCTGIRDAANLAWKLIACLQGADDELLDSYRAERAPHAQNYVETAMRLGGLINSLDRDKALKMAEDQANGHAQMRSITPKLGSSALINTSENGSNRLIGRPFGQYDLGQGQRGFDAKIGYHHFILSRQKPDGIIHGVEWLDATVYPELNALLTKQNTQAIWVRPDRYVGAISDNASELMARVKTQLNTKEWRD